MSSTSVFSAPGATSPDASDSVTDPVASAASAGAGESILVVGLGEKAIPVETLQNPDPSGFNARGGRTGVAATSRKLLAHHAVDLDAVGAGFVAATIATRVRFDRLVDPKVPALLNSRSLAGGQMTSIDAGLYLPALFPFSNGRVNFIGARPAPRAVPYQDPTTGEKLAANYVETTYDDLLGQLSDTVRGTLTYGGKYADSIVAGGVAEPGLSVLTVIRLTDCNVQFYAWVPVDGTTRTVQAYVARENLTGSAEKQTSAIVELILRSYFGGGINPAHGAAVLDITQDVKTNIGLEVGRLESEMAEFHALGDQDDLIRYRQTLVLPEELPLGWGTQSQSGANFTSGVAHRVRARHVNAKSWTREAQSDDTVEDVMNHALSSAGTAQAGVLEPRLLTLMDAADAAACRAALASYDLDVPVESAALWRAAVLLRELTTNATQGWVKRVMRTSTGRPYISRDRYAAFVGAIIDRPWRVAKEASRTQAANAWSRGGALTKEMFEKAWELVYTSDLDALAVAIDRDSRMTLAALGGSALIADRFLTSDVIAGTGSGGEVKTAYRVSRIDTVIEDLSSVGNTVGREQLAAAAKAFQSDGECRTPWRPNERKLRLAKEKADIARAGGLDAYTGPSWYDVMSVRANQKLTSSELLAVADWTGERTKDAGGTPKGTQPIAESKTPLDQVAALRKRLKIAVAEVQAAIDDLDSVSQTHGLEALASAASRMELTTELINAANLLTGLGVQPVSTVSVDEELEDDATEEFDDAPDDDELADLPDAEPVGAGVALTEAG